MGVPTMSNARIDAEASGKVRWSVAALVVLACCVVLAAGFATAADPSRPADREPPFPAGAWEGRI